MTVLSAAHARFTLTQAAHDRRAEVESYAGRLRDAIVAGADAEGLLAAAALTAAAADVLDALPPVPPIDLDAAAAARVAARVSAEPLSVPLRLVQTRAVGEQGEYLLLPPGARGRISAPAMTNDERRLVDTFEDLVAGIRAHGDLVETWRRTEHPSALHALAVVTSIRGVRDGLLERIRVYTRAVTEADEYRVRAGLVWQPDQPLRIPQTTAPAL